jgi:hypothetical protein
MSMQQWWKDVQQGKAEEARKRIYSYAISSANNLIRSHPRFLIIKTKYKKKMSVTLWQRKHFRLFARQNQLTLSK